MDLRITLMGAAGRLGWSEPSNIVMDLLSHHADQSLFVMVFGVMHVVAGVAHSCVHAFQLIHCTPHALRALSVH